MILSIVKEPDPILRKKAQLVQDFTPEIQRLIDNMIETMHAAEGVGLAANQIGSPWHILVASADGIRGKELVLLNASMTRQDGLVSSAEGCLSLPGISSLVTRSSEVEVNGLDRGGNPETVGAAGLLARILQHEVDHLEGHLYIDRVPLWDRRRLLQRYRSLGE